MQTITSYDNTTNEITNNEMVLSTAFQVKTTGNNQYKTYM